MRIFISILFFVCTDAISHEDLNWHNVKNGNIYPDSAAPDIPKRFSSRIVGGKEALQGQFPYQVGLLLDAVGGQIWCGGSLIASRWVLTAAHCLDDVTSGTVFLGAVDIRINERTRQIIHVDESHFIVHSGWNPNLLTDDIALIKLPEGAHLNGNVEIIDLPSVSERSESFAGSTTIASGWGRISDDATGMTPILRYVDLEVISETECRQYFGGYIRSTTLCTSGYQYKSTCRGDSGGPLVYVNGNTKFVIGISSFGSYYGCEIGYPSVYTRVGSYLDWIRQYTN